MKSTFDTTAQCVYCGLCSSVCPTYQLTRNETESPRGRVIAAAHFTKNNLRISPRFKTQMNNCLQCGACERICPAQIPITQIVSELKGKFTHQPNTILRWLIAKPSLFNVLFHLAHRLNLYKLPASFAYSKFKTTQKPSKKNASNIILFTGCTGKNIDTDTLRTSEVLLDALQVSYTSHTQSSCCGNLHYHSGDLKTADKLEKHNRKIFKNTQTVLYFISGCQTGLQKSSDNSIEIIDFLSQQNKIKLLKFKPLSQKVLVHIPCSHQSTPNIKNKLQKLLENIPKIQLIFVEDQGSCCGSAGVHQINHKQRAKDLRQPFVDFTQKHQPNFVVSTNVGCRLHLSEGITQNNVKILHPISLLAQQLL